MLVSRNKRMGKTGIAPVWWAPMMLWREVSDQTSAISDTTSAHRVAKEPGIRSRTTFGRAVYAIGNRERAAYLSGIDPQAVPARKVTGIAKNLTGTAVWNEAHSISWPYLK
jgi:hypothetical protein